MDEKEAIERLQRGDIGGLEYLVSRYQVAAVRTAYLVTHDLPQAQDVVQSAFLNAYERIGQFETGRPFGPWFFTSVLRAAIKAARERDRQIPYHDAPGEVADALLVDDEHGPEAAGEQSETAREVWAALDKLIPEQRAAVIARYFLGLSQEETARALSAPLSTVKWRLHAARQRLRLLLHTAAIE